MSLLAARCDQRLQTECEWAVSCPQRGRTSGSKNQHLEPERILERSAYGRHSGMMPILGSSLYFLKSQGTGTGSVHFSQFSYTNGCGTADREMQQINPGVLDVLLPAVVTCAAALEFIESDLPDETNHFGFVGSNGI